MRLAYISNFMNHHQLELSQELYRNLNGAYTFIALEELPLERKNMGYSDMNTNYPFILVAYKDLNEYKKAIEVIENVDVLIVGSAPDEILLKRLKKGKLTFKCSERYFKSNHNLLVFLKNLYTSIRHIRKFQRYNLYYLCSSAYTAMDVNMFANYKDRVFKWGYFPKVKIQDVEKLFELKNGKKKIQILWVGRLINLKHPDIALEIAKVLKEKEYSYEMLFIGEGELKVRLEEGIEKNKLSPYVRILNFMSPEQVREYMEKADIFLFTSSFEEGWGAVLNEAMNSGCAVVASHAIGSVPYLIRNRKNGLIYKNGNTDEAIGKIEFLLKNPTEIRRLGESAYRTIVDEWSAKIAAKRLIELLTSEDIKGFSKYTDGPCSRAELLKDGWFKDE